MASEIASFKSKLPPGYDVIPGGTVEDSAKARASIFAVFPLMLFIMITILMVQPQSFQRLFLVLATAPLALIGVAAALLVSGAPMGFVAILGIISLIGMVIRNSVILIDQIETEIADGEHPWNQVHRPAHSGHHLAWDHPVGQSSRGVDLKAAQHRHIPPGRTGAGRWHMMTRRKRLLFYLSRAPGEVALRR